MLLIAALSRFIRLIKASLVQEASSNTLMSWLGGCVCVAGWVCVCVWLAGWVCVWGGSVRVNSTQSNMIRYNLNSLKSSLLPGSTPLAPPLSPLSLCWTWMGTCQVLSPARSGVADPLDQLAR